MTKKKKKKKIWIHEHENVSKRLNYFSIHVHGESDKLDDNENDSKDSIKSPSTNPKSSSSSSHYLYHRRDWIKRTTITTPTQLGSLLLFLTTMSSTITKNDEAMATLSATEPLLMSSSSLSAIKQRQLLHPIADISMIRLSLQSKEFMNQEYISIPVQLPNNAIQRLFIIDSGLSIQLITPSFQQQLNDFIIETKSKEETSSTSISQEKNNSKKSNKNWQQIISSSSVLSTEGRQSQEIVDLVDLQLCCGNFYDAVKDDNTIQSMSLPPLHAVVNDFPQQTLLRPTTTTSTSTTKNSNFPVDGILGMEFLSKYDVEFDFSNNSQRLKLWTSGVGPFLSRRLGMIRIPSTLVGDTGLLGIRLVCLNTPDFIWELAQPVPGIINTGSSLTIMNWAAAQALGLPPQGDPYYTNKGNDEEEEMMIVSTNINGVTTNLTSTRLSLSFVGDSKRDSLGEVRFERPSSKWTPWADVMVGIGDNIPMFNQLLGGSGGRMPYRGPAILVGLDILSQKRFILSTAGNGRNRNIYIDP